MKNENVVEGGKKTKTHPRTVVFVFKSRCLLLHLLPEMLWTRWIIKEILKDFSLLIPYKIQDGAINHASIKNFLQGERGRKTIDPAIMSTTMSYLFSMSCIMASIKALTSCLVSGIHHVEKDRLTET